MHRRSVCGGALAALVAATARAQSWPPGRLTFVVPYPPGASSDLGGRLMAEQVGAALGRPVVVDNRPGAAGALGSKLVADAAPDGATILCGNNATHVVQPILNPSLRYDPVRDFTPIAGYARAPVFFGVHADLPVRSLAELIAYAKREPGKLTYGTAGSGSFGNFAGEALKLAAGIEMLHVPYRGTAAAVNDLLAGRISLVPDPAVLVQRDSGKVRVIGVSSAERSPAAPDVPTLRESGLPDYVLEGWFGLLGPAQLPAEVVGRISGIVAASLREAQAPATILRMGLTPDYIAPEALAAQIAADLALFRGIKQRARIEVVE
ncbi:Bug family tripartite tricarboxylate transporter substrate binding protein [Roseomonas sp. BN140053]|uniref:Bug family tripartite tricarboxylate transporter substrate binding protein n=1 Tax=Roseomonas sp. BN140053 TaxID=3391898 RepID=UPI0039E9FA10